MTDEGQVCLYCPVTGCCGKALRNLAVHGLVQGLADGAGAGELGLEVGLDLVGQHGLGQIGAEDGRVRQDAVQLIGDGLGLAELDAGELGLKVVLQRISGNLKGIAVVVDGQQVAQPAGDGQRNGNQRVQVAALGDVALDGLAKADADLLGGVGGDALRHVGHEGVGQALLNDLVNEGLRAIVTSKNTFIAAFVNAERPQYLVVEDKFPNGRPALEKAGVYLTDRETVNKTERMKVTTCLNPLHTAMSVYGCMLGYTLICDEMKDETLVKLVKRLGYVEGLPVVVDPVILSPKAFIIARESGEREGL